MKSQPGPLMTLGAAAAANVRIIVWCRDCQHQVEPEPGEQARLYGAEISVLTGGIGSSAPIAAAVRSIWC
jgi:hypothetical protein